MHWNDLSIGKQIRIGFAVILGLLIVIGTIGYIGISRMKTNAAQVIDGNKLDAILAQHEVEHLNWANAINAFLTDPTVVTMNTENEHQCLLGQWLDSQARTKYETEIKSLIPLIKDLEEPHLKLHQSAVEIQKVFKHVDQNLLGLLNESESDHLRWASQIRQAFMQKKDALGVEADPGKCTLGRWLASKEAHDTYNAANAAYKKSWDELVKAHRELHESAKEIEARLAFGQAESAQAERKSLMATLEANGDILNGMFDELMSKTVRPRRQDAEADNNVSELITWSTAESAINQTIIRSLLEMRRTLSQYETEKTQVLWNEFESKIPEFNEGMGIAMTTLNSVPELLETNNKILKISKEWLKDAMAYKEKMDIGIKAEASIREAQGIFDEKTMPLVDQTINHLAAMKVQVKEELKGVNQAQQIYAAQTLPALQKVQALLNQTRTEAKKSIMTDQAMLDSVKATQKTVTVVSAFAVFLGIFCGFFIPRGIIKVLAVISKQMDDAANQVASAAEQLSASSQSLASGTSEQASAMGETSSSLETMAAKTQQNESNVKEADSLMKDANSMVTEADAAMDALSVSIKEISEASQETQKIIKTIDEIAFQTNLLALNAAVEAARAGEAGAGFSVVADEVRNLAIRAAQAAKNTSELIEGTVRRVKDGAAIVDKTNTAMTKVSESALKIGELLSEIAVASHDQTRGIEQINQNIADVDGVTQQNASSAEESASASEEMSAQAEQMKDLVRTLTVLVGGKTHRDDHNRGYHSRTPMIAMDGDAENAYYSPHTEE